MGDEACGRTGLDAKHDLIIGQNGRDWQHAARQGLMKKKKKEKREERESKAPGQTGSLVGTLPSTRMSGLTPS